MRSPIDTLRYFFGSLTGNWGTAIRAGHNNRFWGMAGGAIVGALVGSLVFPIGTVVGLLVGGLLGMTVNYGRS